MWKKRNGNVKKLMADIVVKRISVCRLICVKAMCCAKGMRCVKVMCCAFVVCGTILTACGVQDKALVLFGEETVQADVEEAFSNLNVEAVASTDFTMAGSSGAATENGSCSQAESAPTIVVFVCGAVQNPGVVELPEGSRAADALEAAGGLLADAQSDYVNLAVKLEDAQKLYFPTVEEAGLLIQEERNAASGLVNINTADKERLCTLPGIGETRAEAIIAYREKNGDFRSGEEIMQVSGIKQSAYDKLRDYITVE